MIEKLKYELNNNNKVLLCTDDNTIVDNFNDNIKNHKNFIFIKRSNPSKKSNNDFNEYSNNDIYRSKENIIDCVHDFLNLISTTFIYPSGYSTFSVLGVYASKFHHEKNINWQIDWSNPENTVMDLSKLVFQI